MKSKQPKGFTDFLMITYISILVSSMSQRIKIFFVCVSFYLMMLLFSQSNLWLKVHEYLHVILH